MDERELVKRLQQKDEQAFQEVVRRYKDRVVNYLWQLMGDYEKAVDLAQETFLRVFFKAHKYRPIAPLASWIYTIASNLAKTELRRMKKMNTVSFDDIKNIFIEEEPTYNSPEKDELIRTLRAALNRLSPHYRIPLILKDLEGFSQEEIAQILRLPLGTVKARISRGRKRLKKELEKTTALGAGRSPKGEGNHEGVETS
jgi:RNA polymerase sigma-70 factor (ECF subfamily)